MCRKNRKMFQYILCTILLCGVLWIMDWTAPMYVVVALNCYTIWYDQMYVDLPFPSKEIEAFPFKARQLFLTMWCLIVQTAFFSVSFLNDIAGTNATATKNLPLIRRAKDLLFSLAFTMAIYVSSVFWGIYIIDKNLIFPNEIDKLFPVWMNHVMHTLIVPFIFIELLVTRRNYPSRALGVGTLVVVMWAYLLSLVAVYVKTGMWIYPFLGYLNWPFRVVFSFGSMFVGLVLYVLGEKINYLVSPKAVYVNGVNGKKKH